MRSDIRAAAARVIKRLELGPGDVRSYEQVTIRAVIEEANISIGTFYKYFKNREELGQALWAEPVAELRLVMQADFDAATDPVAKIRSLLENYVQFSKDNQRVFKGAFLFVRPDKYHPPQKFELKDEVFYRNLCDGFEEGQQRGVFKTFDRHDMAQVFWAAIHGSLALPVNLDSYDFDGPDTLPANMIDALLEMISA